MIIYSSLFFFIFPFIPTLRTLDKIYVDFTYLSIISFIFIYLLITKRGNLLLSKLKKKEILFFSIFLIISLISFTHTFNIIESIISFSKYLTFYLILILIYTLSENKRFDFLLVIAVGFLSIEALKIFSVFLENFTFEKGLNRIRELQGFSFNPNIGSFSLVVKTPILIYCIYLNKNRYLKFILSIFLIIVFFDVLIIGSRGGILALIFLNIILFIYSFFLKNKSFLKHQSIIILVFVLISLLQSNLYKNNNNLSVQNRIMSYNDDSVKGRLNFYKACFDKIIENPILGVGIGNWKILSLKYGKENIKSYEVPYHAHNDFLHLTSEIGLMGALSYLAVFIFPFYFLLLKRKNYSINGIVILLSISVFLIDSNLNFPRARPYSFINIILILTMFNLYREK